ncbi:MAG: lipopolysaccharide heptosyltransferase II [Candidatus Adiutrix sp.]|nr:lipopolysaccharide heptosyltransferase II [Candidatus Adiutrix sp.]
MLKADDILVRGVNWVGDAVMTLPALAALADNFPRGRLTVLARPWVAAVYEGQRGVAAILAHDKKSRNLPALVRLAGELRRAKFDLAVLFQNAFAAALTTALAGIPERWGYARDWRGFLLTKAIELAPSDRYIHESFYYLNMLERAGLTAAFTRPRLKPGARGLAEAESLIGPPDEDGFLLALAPGAAFGAAKQWPAENFAQAAALILERRPGRVMILGSPGEAGAAGRAAAHLAGLGLGPAVLNLAGRSGLAGAIGLMSRASLLLTNDSGLMHLGGALDVPLAAAFGPTDPRTTAPLGRARMVRSAAPCAPCLKRECPLPERVCFNGTTPEKMALAALELLEPRPVRPELSPAVFLDRDGTINYEAGYLSRPEDLKLLPGAARAIAALNRSGFKVVVVTNQSGLARGYFSLADLERVHLRLRELLAAEGAGLDGLYFCPHHEEGCVPEFARPCDCRKPGLALFELAARELRLDLARSFWVGDRLRDIEAADIFGGRGVLTTTGYGLAEAAALSSAGRQPHLVAPDLWRASEWIRSWQDAPG